jgi:hypothetical protein
MLAPIYLPGGQFVACHRTYLQPCAQRGWTKLDVPKPKLVLGKAWGGFIPIAKGASGKSMAKATAEEPVYMAEGIEKCVAIREVRPDYRIVAGVSLGNMGAIVFPQNIRRLVIVADRDDNDKAVSALERVIAQQQTRIDDVRVLFPPAPTRTSTNGWMQRGHRPVGSARRERGPVLSRQRAPGKPVAAVVDRPCGRASAHFRDACTGT